MAGTDDLFMVHRDGEVQMLEFVAGRLVDQRMIDRISRELEAMVERAGVPKIVVSFDNVTSVSSGMIATLIGAQKKARAKQGGVRLAAIPAEIREVFKLTRIDNVIKIFDTPEQAAAKFGKS
ncbi:MAG: STAS domain-containing protein [Phycisphaerae bacterium]|nr:STAS domain-containing protein [Phycisphaerae bacterium]